MSCESEDFEVEGYGFVVVVLKIRPNDASIKGSKKKKKKTERVYVSLLSHIGAGLFDV